MRAVLFLPRFLPVIGFCLNVSVRAAPGRQEPPARKFSNVDRLAPANLKQVHDDVIRLRALQVRPEPVPGLTEFRCILHAHAEDSAHTGGTLAEMLAAAKQEGISAIFLSDHFRPPRDFIDGRWRGMHDGVLFIPGSEARGFLLHPDHSVMEQMEKPVPELRAAVTAGSGLMFLSHIEERRDHPMDGLTGLEIYNRHWDAKKDMASLVVLGLKLTDPKELAELEESLRLYPDELLAFQCDYPKVYVDKWDAETTRFRLTGVAASDCHHNQVFIVKMVDADTVLVGTNVDTDDAMRRFTAAVRPGIREMTRGHQPGEILVRLDVDPYTRSFRNCSTHILADELTEPALRRALRAGHAFIAFDWLGSAVGFRYELPAPGGRPAVIMGDEIPIAPGLKLTASIPLPCRCRLLRNGVVVADEAGTRRMEFPVREPGVYRLEAWLTLNGETRPWILANPIYVR